MGKMSRVKGRTAEYEVRNIARIAGFDADRVPLSGASQGYKGDVRVRDKDGREQIVEVKIRKDAFKVIYEDFQPNNTVTYNVISSGGDLVMVTTQFGLAFYGNSPGTLYKQLPECRFTKRLTTLKSLLQESHILAIRDNRRPWLFLRYY